MDNMSNKTLGEIAEATGQTRQNLSNKMTRGNFSEKDILSLANVDNMSNKEVVRLIEWLKSKGFSSDDIVECLEYISK